MVSTHCEEHFDGYICAADMQMPIEIPYVNELKVSGNKGTDCCMNE